MRIAFAAPQNGGEEIFVVRVDSKAQERLTASPGATSRRSGRRLAAASPSRRRRSESSRLQGREYGTEIHLMGADGSGVRALTGGNACGLATESEGKLNSLDQADWTSDGRRLLYRAGVCKMDCTVCVVDVDAGRVHPLVAERMVVASPSPRTAGPLRTREAGRFWWRTSRATGVARWSRADGGRPGRGTADAWPS